MNPAPMIILGGALAWLTLFLFGLKKIRAGEFILGVFLFFLAIFAQGIIQQVPFLWTGIKSNADLVSKGIKVIILASVWIGLTAALFQEGSKFFFVRRKSYSFAYSVGLGFGTAEVLMLALNVTLVGMKVHVDVPLTIALLTMAERYLVLLFHVGTAILLANGTWKVLLSVIGAHAVVDTLASFYTLSKLISQEMAFKVLIISEGVLGIVTFVILLFAVPVALKGKEDEEEVEW
ncbi:hypothetical protein [Pyrococcus sp. ST04]|uniref:hypothetical protein n=1 Tax=Pyrococcus sp. ST04 TaxID=1183377 RepID=UPI0002605DD7|nr:hypothetical protein [Pyrococcus sp. ST04]AFK23142.1 hypothetical protein Py04_1571 [Pyrococcus sp. ST04]